MSKDEHKKQQEDMKKAKKDAVSKIPEKEREKQKKYKKVIYITLVLFIAAIVVLGLMVTNVIPMTAGLIVLIVISIASTIVSRKTQKS